MRHIYHVRFIFIHQPSYTGQIKNLQRLVSNSSGVGDTWFVDGFFVDVVAQQVPSRAVSQPLATSFAKPPVVNLPSFYTGLGSAQPGRPRGFGSQSRLGV